MLIKSLRTENILEYKPDQEITFTIDNPLFEDDRLPVAVSTGIEFSLTPTNKTEFGFVEAMMLPPLMQKVPAVIILAGIEIFSGELQFDEFSDSALKYTFVGKGMDEMLAGNIYEIPSNTYDDILLSTFVQNARKGYYRDFGLPMIIRQPNSAKVEYTSAAGAAECSLIDKYANFLYTDWPYIVPAIKVPFLFEKILPGVYFPSNIDWYINQLAVIATYKPESLNNSYYGAKIKFRDSYEPGTGRRSIPYILDFRPTEGLPDMTNSEFVSNILKMFCATLFSNKTGYVIQSNKEIINDKTFINWSDKVAEIYSIVAGEESGYSLEYANENSNYTPSKVDDLGQAEIDPSIITCYTYEEMCSKFQTSANYINIQIAQTRNIYSGKQVKARLYYHYEGRKGIVYNNFETPIATMDIVYQAGLEKKIINRQSEDSKSYENSIGFICAKCVPANVATPILESSTNSQVTLRGMSPIIEFPTVGAERPTTVYIGMLRYHNFFDQGNYFGKTTPYVDGGTEMSDNIYSIAIGGEKGLYEMFHKDFAEWVMKKKDTIKADVFLSPTDVANLQLWRKIMIYNRLFLIKTMELTISDKTDIVFANVEFVEV